MNKKIFLLTLLALPTAVHAADDGGGLMGLLGLVLKNADGLVSWLLDFVTGLVMTGNGAIMFFILMLGKFLLYIGLTFGPLFIACTPFKPLRHAAMKWVQFMFGAVMYSAVATVVVVLCSGLFARLGEYNSGQASAGVPATLISMVAIMIAVVAGLIMWRVPNIVGSLFGAAINVQAPSAPKVKVDHD